MLHKYDSQRNLKIKNKKSVSYAFPIYLNNALKFKKIYKEESIKERTRADYESQVHDLQVQLTIMHNQFEEYKAVLQKVFCFLLDPPFFPFFESLVHVLNFFSKFNSTKDMMAHLSAVKNEAMLKMVDSGTAPMELKRQALKMVKAEEDMMALREEAVELKRTLLQVCSFFALK